VSNEKKLLAVTMGDPAGIGPEVCIKAVAQIRLENCVPVIFGDARILQHASLMCDRPMPTVVASLDEAIKRRDASTALILNIPSYEGLMPPIGISAATGEAAFRYIEAAIDAALNHQVAGVVTGPINKEALHLAGHPYPGHTEIFAERTTSERSCMMLTSPELTCSFVTTHVGLGEVPSLLSMARIVDVIELTYDAMKRLRGRAPRLVGCALNPHAGENGLFGHREEERIIVPALEQARSRGIEIAGPLPADTAFLAKQRRATDAFICMYHDQGLIPLKTLAFDLAVNTTLGLPIVRTSVDHGTALDIAWQNQADHSSMIEAMKLAERLG
jgi:4-phospho-D-threonate 3-dehydrogenase / 4-phospho-D-erythronate 3-dehydrogenase